MNLDFDLEIKNLELKIEEIKEKKIKYLLMTDEQKLAIELHSKKCNDHFFGSCRWHDENDENGEHNWSRGVHRKYLERANEILKEMDIETALKSLKYM